MSAQKHTHTLREFDSLQHLQAASACSTCKHLGCKNDSSKRPPLISTDMLRSTLLFGAVAVAAAFSPSSPAGLQLRARATCNTAVKMSGGEIQKMDRGMCY
jgi:hypothetical protein